MSFQVGSLSYKNRQFILEDRPFTILSGAMHYFRIPQQYWQDRLLKLKACGLNTVETYVPWNLHEEIKGQYSFDGMLDVRKYMQMAHDLGLKVILRPGPYICSEWDLGGLPSWLLHDPEMKLRSNYPPYQKAVSDFFEKLIPMVTDLQYSRGGPIIMVQVENEFGSYSDEEDHLIFIKDLLIKYGITESLVLSDNIQGARKALIPQALLTVNFPDVKDGSRLFNMIRDMGPNLPLLVMEFWTGWFDHWGKKHHTVPPDDFAKVLRFILEDHASVNLYMFHGGTNFGFMAGANFFSEYQADVTSYDYDAMLSEAGDMTPKYYRTQQIVHDLILKPQGLSLPNIDVTDVPKMAYGSVKMEVWLGWEDIISLLEPVLLKNVVTMEMLDINNGGGQNFGYIVYRKELTKGGTLTIEGYVRDRAQIFVDGKETAVLDCKVKDQEVDIRTSKDSFILDILVENLGRVNYCDFKTSILNEQRKGICGNVLLDGDPLEDWQIYPLEFKAPFQKSLLNHKAWSPSFGDGPCASRGELVVENAPQDTFLKMEGWEKGIVFMNGFHLGRYWNIGPQRTLYVPAPVLKTGSNQILIFELHKSGSVITFEDQPDLG
ncbi:beta-galactosidase-1-like protein 2 [Liolophura sinensis]|uniref:beta-galactosidase-1-like protein 2 n=1 Tax=Liolophura sinensis TaxID=3198878 RepID=UPI0031587069